jgi:AraC-like DNA-binding protein
VVTQPAADKVAKRLLILLLLGMIAMAFCLFYIYAGMLQYWPRLSCIEIGFTSWIGPSLYFYLKRINGGADPFANKWNWLHWLPALVFELALLPFFLRPVGEQPFPTPVQGRIVWFTWWFFHVQLCVYILLCQPHLRVYRQKLVANFSTLSVVNLRWLQLCAYGFIGVILSERLLPALHLTSTSLSQVAGMSVYLFVIALTWSALGQSRLAFAGDWQPAPAEPANGASTGGGVNGKYHRSGLRDDSAQYYLDKLNRLMSEERPYLDGELSLQALAEQVRISPHHLSQVLNDKLGKTFYDYINEQRVEYAKALLVQEPHKAITDIAFAAGYNSKNSFYNAFKRHAGMAPSEFRAKDG